jgi:hypothetical protein
MSDKPQAIVFFHCGNLPGHLLCALESARVFNSDTPIFLISDQVSNGKLSEFGVQTIPLQDTQHPNLKVFLSIYKHISSVQEVYERRCFERWFHIEQLIEQNGLLKTLYLDSDCLLFENLEGLFDMMPEKTMCASRGGGPACTLIRGSLNAFLDLMLTKFSDTTYIQSKIFRMQRAVDRGSMANLTDMDLVELFTTEHPEGYVYPNSLPNGHIDHCLNLPDGMEFLEIPHRKKKRKLVFWAEEGGWLRPYFRIGTSGHKVRALTIHYQSGAKRLIRRFNHHNGHYFLPQSVRRLFFQWMHTGWGSQYL